MTARKKKGTKGAYRENSQGVGFVITLEQLRELRDYCKTNERNQAQVIRIALRDAGIITGEVV